MLTDRKHKDEVIVYKKSQTTAAYAKDHTSVLMVFLQSDFRINRTRNFPLIEQRQK